MAAVLPARRSEHWVSKVDKKIDKIPLIGTVTNLTKLIAKLIFKTIENLIPKISRPITSLRVVRAITAKKIGTYIFHAIPFWFVLDAMARIGAEQQRQDAHRNEQRRQAIEQAAHNYVNARIGPGLQELAASNANFELFSNASKQYSDLLDSLKKQNLLKLKKEDPSKFEAESDNYKMQLKDSLEKLESALRDLKTIYERNNEKDYPALERRVAFAFAEQAAALYPDSESPPDYLLQDNALHEKIIETWKNELKSMQLLENMRQAAGLT